MTLKTDIDQIAVDAGKLHDIVHGGPSAVVATDGGAVKSVAKAITDLEVQIVTEAGSYVDQCQDEVALATAQAQTATNQAAAAAGSALSAASVVAQDLSAIDRTVFSATLVDAFIYDTSKDSDGGAWRKRCSHTSWENETLSGNWLGSATNEAAARAISGATTGSYYYDTTALGFYTLNAGSGKTVTYRGNVRQFPAQVLITVEAARVVLWDLTQAGVPMWMVFIQSTGQWSNNYMLGDSVVRTASTAAAAVNGQIAVSCPGIGIVVIRFLSDDHYAIWASGNNGRNRTIANRHVLFQANPINATPALVSNAANDVAMTVLPNAPVDVATGLPIPTIAVATNGGISVIKNDGTVVNSTSTTAMNKATAKGEWLFYSATGLDNVIAKYLPGISAGWASNYSYTFATTTAPIPLSLAASTTYRPLAMAMRAKGHIASGNVLGVSVFTENPGSSAAGMVAHITKDYNSGWQVGAIKGAWLADTVAETLTGTELVTNGTFATDTTGWTQDGGGTIASVSGKLRVTNTATPPDQTTAYQVLTVVAGKSYVLSLGATNGTGTNNVLIRDSGSLVSGTIMHNASWSGPLTIVPTGTSIIVACRNNATGGSYYSDFDNISCRLADVDRSVKTKGLQAFGSLTKAAVASGAALMGYSGFSAANYLEQPYNSDLDFGTGDFCIVGWLSEAPNAAIEYLFNRDSATPGKAIRLWVSVAGYLVFELYDGTTTRTATGTVAVDTSTRLLWLVTYSAGTLTIYVNGVSYATATGAALLTLTNASAVTRVGLDVAGSYPATNANLALVRAGATVPSAEQIKHIYETEKALFEANAQCCLAGSSNAVTALAYDEETDLLHVGTSYGRSAFKGLARVASEATPVGAITALAAGAGVIAQAGASGADVYVPAYSLREELLRDAEQMARFGQSLVAHDFTATASQEVFTLPVGWEIVAVYQQGTLKRETTAWVRTFDGFKWSVDLVTGATVSDWISILAKRV